MIITVDCIIREHQPCKSRAADIEQAKPGRVQRQDLPGLQAATATLLGRLLRLLLVPTLSKKQHVRKALYYSPSPILESKQDSSNALSSPAKLMIAFCDTMEATSL